MNHSSAQPEYSAPRTVDELTEKNVRTVVAIEETARARRTRGDVISDAISNFCGSITFVWFHVALFAGWISWNTLLAPKGSRFDPYPFTFLTLVVSLEAIFLSAFIMISQNAQTRMSERRNHLDLQINLLSEQENTKMLEMLDAIARKVGAHVDDDPSLSVLEEAMEPEQLIEQIDKTIERSDAAQAETSLVEDLKNAARAE